MALVLIEGFDHMGTLAAVISKNWGASNQASMSLATGRLGGQALHSVDGTRLWTKGLPSTYSTLTVGCALLLSGVQSSFDYLYLQAAGTAIFRVSVNASSKLIVRNSAGTTIATGTTTILPNVWYYIELKAVVGTSGTCEVHLNGVTEIASTVGNFGTTNIDTLGLTFQGNGVPQSVDDIYVCDTTGSLNTTFLGDVRVETIYPDGDGAHTQWTPDSGSPHFSRVDETSPDGDTSYVADGTVGDRDSYTFGALASLLGTVFGIQTNVYARKDDVGTRQVCAVTRPTTVDHDGATKTLATSYQYFSEIAETNPDTSAAWTISDVDGAEFGVKVVA